MNPVARRTGLVVRELGSEVVVYDRERHQAHCLNETAATVFHAADGHRSVAELAALFGNEAPIETREDVVRRTLERLEEAQLLEGGPAAVAGSGMSRREVVRRVGLGAAVLLPIVTSILAPTPTEAAATCVTSCSGQPNGTPCTCFAANPCTDTCIGGACSDGGPC